MGLGCQRHAPAALSAGQTRYPLYRRMGLVGRGKSRPHRDPTSGPSSPPQKDTKMCILMYVPCSLKPYTLVQMHVIVRDGKIFPYTVRRLPIRDICRWNMLDYTLPFSATRSSSTAGLICLRCRSAHDGFMIKLLQEIFWCVRKIAKSDYQLRYVFPSVRTSTRLSLHMSNFAPTGSIFIKFDICSPQTPVNSYYTIQRHIPE
jgi:hypothetical protein